MAFPIQKQEAFLEGHIQAFHYFGGVPRRITYDNLKTAVFRILKGHNRQEQEAFVAFRSYYLFDSHYCNVRQAHEKGGVESDVGYACRNFMAPMPRVASFAALNDHLRQVCQQDTRRRSRGEKQTVAELWQAEKGRLLPLPPVDYPACATRAVTPFTKWGESQPVQPGHARDQPVLGANGICRAAAGAARLSLSGGSPVSGPSDRHA